MSKIYLCVPPWDERDALQLNAKHTPEDGFFITETHFIDDFLGWLPHKWHPDYAGKALLPDMLPTTAWNKNVRTTVSDKRWGELRKYCYSAAGWRCEICGSKGKPKLECHEEWNFSTGIQKLSRLITLCELCHKAKHMGRANSTGALNEVLSHILQVNGWTNLQLQDELDILTKKWRKLSSQEWKTLDISWLISYNIPHYF